MKNGAYILIGTVLGASFNVSQGLHRYDWVETVERVVGAYDAMVVTKGGLSSITESMARDVIEQMDGVVHVVVCPLRNAAPDAFPDLKQRNPDSSHGDSLQFGEKTAFAPLVNGTNLLS